MRPTLTCSFVTFALVTTPAFCQQADVSAVTHAVELTKSVCLADAKQFDLRANADGSVSVLKLTPGATGSARITQTQGASGALSYQDEGIRLQAEQPMWKCIDKNLPVMLTAVGAKLATSPQEPKPVRRDTRVCFGEGGGNNCQNSGALNLGCGSYRAFGDGGKMNENLGRSYCSIVKDGSSVQEPYSISMTQNNGGGGCGWTGFIVTCNP